MIMATFEGISQVHVEFPQGRRTNRVVRKWSDEQTELFAAVLSLRYSKDGEESSLAVELENLAVKKSSNEKLFREIQANLEDELIKIDQSFRDNDEEATFSVPQLRAKYKWLKREWKIIQNKLSYEEVKLPSWYKLLDPVFSVYQSVNKDEIQERPSMVIENGSLQIGESNTDGDNDSHAAIKKRNTGSALNRPESFETEKQVETAQRLINKTPNNILSRQLPRIDPIPIVRVSNNSPKARPSDGQTIQDVTRARSEDATSEIPPRKTIRLDPNLTERINEGGTSFPPGINPNINRCVCRSESDRYVEIIKHLLDAEERRERMFIAFQKEQAEANRQHELNMAQFFAQSLSQQQVLSQGIHQILQSLSKSTDKK